MATHDNQSSLRRLTKNESELRRKEDERQKRQWYIETVVKKQLELYHAKLMLLLSRRDTTPFPDTDPHPLISPWSPTMQQLADQDTIMYPITPLPHSIIEKANTSRPLPNTGEIMKEITQDKQPNKPTSSRHTYQNEYDQITQLRQGLITRCQEALRTHYQKQFALQHPGEEFSQDTQCMAHALKMTALNKLTLCPLDQGKYFPETRVLVEVDSSLGDQIICE